MGGDILADPTQATSSARRSGRVVGRGVRGKEKPPPAGGGAVWGGRRSVVSGGGCRGPSRGDTLGSTSRWRGVRHCILRLSASRRRSRSSGRSAPRLRRLADGGVASGGRYR